MTSRKNKNVIRDEFQVLSIFESENDFVKKQSIKI
jgi:hypothetical protein